MSSPARFAVVGTGWRADFFHRVAALIPEQLEITSVVAHRDESAARAEARLRVPVRRGIDELIASDGADVVIVSVATAAAPAIVERLVDAGRRVLLETPPAPDAAGLVELWSRVGESGLVQVAEQYLRYPGHVARAEAVRRGLIGRPTSVQVSSTHEYHAISMIRGLLGVGRASAEVRAQRFVAPLVDPVTRDGRTAAEHESPAGTVLATLDFGAAMGLYDFTDNQWFNPLRHRRIVVRGTRGEIADDRIVRLADPRTVVESAIVRRQIGHDLDLEGYATDHLSIDGEIVWRNAFPGTRMSDEDLAIAEMLVATGDWARGAGPASYPLGDAVHDQALTLAIRAALESGAVERSLAGPWQAWPS